MKPSYSRSKPSPPKPPVNPAEGSARIQAFAVQTFDRKDGTGADWRMLTESLFRAAFDQLDKLPEPTKEHLAHRVHAGAYDRFLAFADPDSGGSNSATPLSSPPNEGVFQPTRKPGL